MIPPLERLLMIEKFANSMISVAKIQLESNDGDSREQENILVRVLTQVHEKMKQLVPTVCDYNASVVASQQAYYFQKAVRGRVSLAQPYPGEADDADDSF